MLKLRTRYPWRVQRTLTALYDFILWLLVWYLTLEIWWEWELPADVAVNRMISTALTGAVMFIAVATLVGIYTGKYRYGSLDETRWLFMSVMAVTIVQAVIYAVKDPENTDMVIISGAFIIVGLVVRRSLTLMYRSSKQTKQTGEPTLIIGAGEQGIQMVNLLLGTSSSLYKPVGFLDDDASRSRLDYRGVRVLGKSSELADVLYDSDIKNVLLSEARDAAGLLNIQETVKLAGAKLIVVPELSEIMSGKLKIGDISEVTEEDLLGRRPISTDETSLAKMIEGKRVLITGAGGSIGSELSRQVSHYNPSFLGMLDHDESHLHDVQLSITGRALLDSDTLLLGDIRDVEQLELIFSKVRPEVVIHAAALKHVTFLQRFPQEAYKTNVVGTNNVLELAKKHNVECFVNISTDKAANPINSLGFSKLIAERLTAGVSRACPGSKYVSVRFGNVLGSRGSVLPTFRAQIAQGGPVTVTDPGATRYFMTIPEAVHLVLQAAVVGQSGQTLILDMGTPVNIAQVAKMMISKSGRNIDIEYTGLRDGEKMDEVLEGDSEKAGQTSHDMVTSIKVEALDRVPNLDLEQPLEQLKNLACRPV